MPWIISKNGGKCGGDKPWAVLNQKTGDLIGCHATKEKARAQQKLLYASEPNLSSLTKEQMMKESREPTASASTISPMTENTSVSLPATITLNFDSSAIPSNGVIVQPENGFNPFAPVQDPGMPMWEGVLGIEGLPTDDGRYLMPGEITERELPLTLMVQFANEDGHQGAMPAGKITDIWRQPNPDLGPNAIEIWGSGPFDDGEVGQEAARMVENQTLRGVSLDLSIASASPLDPETYEPIDSQGMDLMQMLTGDFLTGIAGKIMGATLCAFPAFGEATVRMVPDDVEQVIVASAFGMRVKKPFDIGQVHALVAADSSPLVPAIQTVLGNVTEMYLDAHGCHWNVTGDDFAAYHTMFETIYSDVFSSIDTFAEILLKLGGRAPIGLQAMGALDQVPPVMDSMDPQSLTEQLCAVNDAVLDSLTAAFAVATAVNEQGVCNFVAERIDHHQKWRWQMMASLGLSTSGEQLVPEEDEDPDAAVEGAEVQSVLGPILASAVAPLHPPKAWFEIPEPDKPTPITIRDDGRVFGHLATFDQCHASFRDHCELAPKSKSGYKFFHVGGILTEEGETLPVGRMTVGKSANKGGHNWSLFDDAKGAIEHYDRTGAVAAFVRAKDGKHGIWLSGVLKSDATPEQVRDLRANPPSGDWRWENGGYELVAALAVPVPGYPVPYLTASAGDEPRTLIIMPSSPGEEKVMTATRQELRKLSMLKDRARDALAAQQTCLACGTKTSMSDMVCPECNTPLMPSNSQTYSQTYCIDEPWMTFDHVEGLSTVQKKEETFAYNAAERKKMADNGEALPDGSFPIANCADAENAIHAQGRAQDQGKAVAHIKKRVAALGCTGSIFDNYK